VFCVVFTHDNENRELYRFVSREKVVKPLNFFDNARWEKVFSYRQFLFLAFGVFETCA
jgi:hypothetical protein